MVPAIQSPCQRNRVNDYQGRYPLIQYLDCADVSFPDNKEAERARRVTLYAAQYDGYLEELGVRVPEGQRIGPFCRPVYCPDLDPKRAKDRDGPPPSASFYSPIAAAEYFGTSRNNILKAMRDGTRCKGRHFNPIPGAPSRRAVLGNEKGVTCVELDIDFETLSEAARWAGVATSTMFYRIKDGRACGDAGYTFTYFDHGAGASDANGSAVTDGDGNDSTPVAAEAKVVEEEDLDAYFGAHDELVSEFLDATSFIPAGGFR